MPCPTWTQRSQCSKRDFTRLVAERYPGRRDAYPKKNARSPLQVKRAPRKTEASGSSNNHRSHNSSVEQFSVILVASRWSKLIAPQGARELYELCKLQPQSCHWGSSYRTLQQQLLCQRVPFQSTYSVSGVDFPMRRRGRHQMADAPTLPPQKFAKMLASRVECTIRSDCVAVPAARNLGLKRTARCGDEAACRHAVDLGKAGLEMAADLTEVAGAHAREIGVRPLV